MPRCTPIVLVCSLLASAPLPATPYPFYMGADISLASFMQDEGVVFRDNGIAKPLDQLLYDRGANLFRLRIFVDPEATYTNNNYGAIQSLAYDIALAQQIKANAPHAKLMLDFHYSDTWADPGKQIKPAAWNNLDFSDLRAAVEDYTRETLLAFRDAGVMPHIVQVGNEISTGMLWGTQTNPAGGRLVFSGSQSTQRASWQNLGQLLNSAISGVRAAQGAGPKIDVAIHIDRGDQDGHPQYYFGNLTNPTWANVSDFDIVGVSYYPQIRQFHSFELLESNLHEMADLYPEKKLMILETNYPWRASGIGIPDWPSTPAGQQQFLAELQEMMLSLPNGAGIVYWYPEAVQVPGHFIYNGGATALFDNNRNVLPAIDLFSATLLAGDYNRDGTVDAADYVVWRQTLDQTGVALAADGNGNGIIDAGDYDVWVWNFGSSAAGSQGGSGGSRTVKVPEPLSIWLALLPAACFAPRRYRGHRL